MENKIKIADIVNRNKGIKNHLLLKEYNEKFDTNKEKFYDENKDNEPLKSKIKQLEYFFQMPLSHGLQPLKPSDKKIDLAKELCQNIIEVDFPTELYTNESNQDKDNDTFNGIIGNIKHQLKRNNWINQKNSTKAKTLTDDEIKKIIIYLPLPSFETEFQKSTILQNQIQKK